MVCGLGFRFECRVEGSHHNGSNTTSNFGKKKMNAKNMQGSLQNLLTQLQAPGHSV